MEHFWSLFKGEVGTVVDGDDWDEENECIVIDGNEYELGEQISDVDSFIEANGTENLVLFRSDAYRGVGCYSGYMKIGDNEYSLDIMNDYVVSEIYKI